MVVLHPSRGQISTEGIYLTMDMLNVNEILNILFAISHGTRTSTPRATTPHCPPDHCFC